MKDALTYANEAGFFSFNVVGWKAEFERLIEAVRADALAELATVNDSLTVQDHIRDATKIVKRPQNCGTGFCSCIECVVKPDHIADAGKMVLTAEQAQQIEEALIALHLSGNTFTGVKIYFDALTTIRAARAQEQAEQEPMAWAYCPECGSFDVRYEEGSHKQCARCFQEWYSDVDYSGVVQQNLNRLYVAPLRTKDLTDEEIAQAVGSPLDEVYLADFRAVIAKFKEKNK